MTAPVNPILRWVWRDPVRRGQRLLRFAEVESDGGRDLARAAELTGDARLRRLYLRHALDEQRHAEIFRRRGLALLLANPSEKTRNRPPDWLSPGERGLDDVQVQRDRDGELLAFLHLSERAAARQFARYGKAVGDDADTRDVFRRIINDETFHMTYTRQELGRVATRRQGTLLWRARLGRLWKGYLRLAAGLGNAIGTVVLTLQYFVLLPPFVWLAKRAQRREPLGWTERRLDTASDLSRQY